MTAVMFCAQVSTALRPRSPGMRRGENSRLGLVGMVMVGMRGWGEEWFETSLFEDSPPVLRLRLACWFPMLHIHQVLDAAGVSVFVLLLLSRT